MREVLIILVLAMATAGTARGESRIAWDGGQASWVMNLFDASNETSRLAFHRGCLTAFTPADAALYAVILSDTDQLARLRSALRENAPRTHTQDVLAATLPATAVERITLGENGALAVFVDEAVHRDAELLVVVNASGEILSTRPVWETPRALVLATE